MSETAVSIGAVTYLNSKPLVEGLAELLPDTRIHLDFPSRLSDYLDSGCLDVALVPSIEYFRGGDYEILSDACVAAHGPVLSVKLYTRVPWGEIKSLALDEGSRTSATLARIMLAERHGVLPKLEPLPLNHQTQDTTADAILLIGDRAILPPNEPFLNTWDLGEEWLAWTGLPFVFAMWLSNRRQQLPAGDVDKIQQALCQSRDWGVERLREIAEREAQALGLTFPTTFNYLSENLHFHLGNAERCGLQTFYELATGLGLAPKGAKLRFRS
ncbi:menaquinone biosynthetic enzyme MqnA/MqnD family protein [Schlesneria sp. T3-172]|uniref:menaquinone biosynthetic enzyme MqnA/MqnD family protein n=1 Tax=Schlesneria sphaerica TaxID=3373610 RepID=UPI0037CA5F5B